MKDQKFWAIFAGVAGVIAAGAGYLIYSEKGQIEDAKAKVATLRSDIATARDTVRKTADIEREVIVLREISDRIREILPNTKDLTNVVRDFQEYSKEAGVATSGFRPSSSNNRNQQTGAFEKVAYQLTLEADTFQFLDFLNRIETHSRFMGASSFKISAASRKSLEKDGIANHRIQMEVETYKYVPRAGEADEVKIAGYERKRDLLAGEINRRRQALTLETFRYRGPRGRRDPLIDPRVPARVDDPNAWTVQRQMEEVTELISRMEEAPKYWEASNAADSVLERMVQRSELEKILAMLGDDLNRIEKEARISYKPAEKRLSIGVIDPLQELRLALKQSQAIAGPTLAELQTVGDTMVRHIDDGQFDLALDSYKALADSLNLVRGDKEREELADWLRQLAEDATTLRDFEQIDLVIGGYAIIEGTDPVVIIDGTRRSVGDPVIAHPELTVHDVRPNEVDFVFRGAVLTRDF
ncbi:MAG: type 4a pilus biogenesis protein PilO [Planctomycetota bacterium]